MTHEEAIELVCAAADNWAYDFDDGVGLREIDEAIEIVRSLT